MSTHKLALDIPDTLVDCTLKVWDSSIYSDNLPTECPKLEVTLPGFQLPSVITTLTPGFTANINACQLGIQVYNCNVQFNPIPDGVYVIRLSYSPNDKLYVEYNHLRVTCALNKINKILCCLDLSDCEPIEPVKSQVRKLKELQMMLQGAKANVEYCHHPKKGMAMYNYVVSQLDKLACSCGCSEECQ